MTTLRLAAASTFGAVTDTMTGIGSVTRGVAKGATAFDKYMDQILFEQERDYAVRRATYDMEAERKVSEKIQREEERLNKWFKEEEGREARYGEILAEVREKVAQYDATRDKK